MGVGVAVGVGEGLGVAGGVGTAVGSGVTAISTAEFGTVSICVVVSSAAVGDNMTPAKNAKNANSALVLFLPRSEKYFASGDIGKRKIIEVANSREDI